ncbi:MAG: protein kinase [Planctomycetaceae bacterium]|nr:protein kinase [Planctomycetaceae bacterium]
MEPPSRPLLELLTRYRLATPADIRRCRGQVRRLALDLPTFDSVWIDALAQARVITPFQARLLESDAPERLQVGPCLLVDEWERDGLWTLHLARHRSNRQKCLLTFVEVSPHERPRAVQQCREMIAQLSGLSHPSLIIPQGCDEVDGKLVVVSPFVTGPTMKQMLVRRGRFPISVVCDIAWQVIDGLAALEERGVVHGDMSLTSVRLAKRGQTVLLHPGVMPAVGNRVSIHAPRGPESYDGVAPELISSGRAATPQSDLYAVGCLLWQLLAGRPPYPTGDPLSKLAAHQTKPMDDIRRWVPDVPAELSGLIRRLTEKNPEGRGSGPAEIRRQWPLQSRFARKRLTAFGASFGTVAPRHGDVHRNASTFPQTAAALLVVVLGGLSLSLFDAGARNELLRLAGRPNITDVVEQEPISAAAPSTTSSASTVSRPIERIPFPSRPVNGVIELTSAGPYSVADVRCDGPLIIRGAPGVMPHILTNQPLRIAATQVRIERVQFSRDDSDSKLMMLAIQSQTLMIEGCRFIGPAAAADAAATAIAWKVSDPTNPTGGKLLVQNSTFTGELNGIETHAMPRSMSFDNCLKYGPGALIRLAHTERSAPLRVHLRQSTLRESGGVVCWLPSASAAALQPLLVIAEDSVFEMPPDRAAFLEFAAASVSGWERMVRVTGEGSLLKLGTQLAAAEVGRALPPAAVDASPLRVEGLLIDDFEFAGSGRQDPRDSAIAFSQAPQSSSTPPGIDARRMLHPPERPVVRQTASP